jgi:ABC-type glutathione transport system ATPase component
MLEVQDLHVAFMRYRGWLGRTRSEPLRGLSLRLERGELVALVGASGAGKSLLAHALLGILPGNAHVHGRIAFDGRPLDRDALARLRGREIALVPQAVTFLDPLARARTQLRWAARAAGRAAPGVAEQALTRYGLLPAAGALYPHQLSGGMARRVLTAMATVSQARLLIADEPTSGLDAEASALALRHLRLLADAGHGVLVITHDLAAVLPHADRLEIVNDGRSVESTTPAAFFAGDLRHAYAHALRAAMPAFGYSLPPHQPASGTPVVQAEGLGFAWPGAPRPLIDGLDLRIDAGEWVALQGPSGCGKTTLARLLAGQLAPQAGRLSVAVGSAPAHPVQWIHQHAERAFNPRLCVGRSLREGWAPPAATLERFGIEATWLERFPHELSGGELQRLNIVRALVPGLRLLIADEMTAMHDTVTQAELWRALRAELAARPAAAVLAITHDDALIEALKLRRLDWRR